jgi:predicted nucleic acid-binding protein
MADESAYVDTRILGAYYCPEPLSAAAEKALRQLKTPVISVLSEVEFCSLISKKHRLHELRERQAKEILDLFSNHVAEGFYRRISLNTDHFIKARLLVASMDSSLRTLDALHLAVALSEGLTLVTADREFARAGKRHKANSLLIG